MAHPAPRSRWESEKNRPRRWRSQLSRCESSGEERLSLPKKPAFGRPELYTLVPPPRDLDFVTKRPRLRSFWVSHAAANHRSLRHPAPSKAHAGPQKSHVSEGPPSHRNWECGLNASETQPVPNRKAEAV